MPKKSPIVETRYTSTTSELRGLRRNVVLKCNVAGRPRPGQACVCLLRDGRVVFRRYFRFQGMPVFMTDNDDAWATVPVKDAVPIVGVRIDQHTAKLERFEIRRPSIRKIVADDQKYLPAAHRCLLRAIEAYSESDRNVRAGKVY